MSVAAGLPRAVERAVIHRLVNDRRFRGLPMLLETLKTEGRPPCVVAVDSLDERNLNTLRGLIVGGVSA